MLAALFCGAVGLADVRFPAVERASAQQPPRPLQQ